MLWILVFISQLFFVKSIKPYTIPPQTPGDQDIITSLPNVTFEIKFKQYSGYLKITDKHQLHYWLLESQGQPEKDPLLLWLNGGPGCSSLIGLLAENGPYRLDWTGEKIIENIYSWNKLANVLYLESPAGVGFSLAGTFIPKFNVAKENHIALLAFAQKFPQFKKRKFFISGESYAGVYIPTLAVEVLKDKQFPFNFQGVAIGNGVFDDLVDANTAIDYLYFRGTFGDNIMLPLRKACNCSEFLCNYYGKSKNRECNKLRDDAWTNCCSPPAVYNIYSSCYDNKYKVETPKGDVQVQKLSHYISPIYAGIDRSFIIYPGHCNIQDKDVLGKYLNNITVRHALHIPKKVVKWQQCNMLLNQFYQSDLLLKTMGDQFKIMLERNLNILLYFGDFDLACNFLGGQEFLRQNLKIKPMENRISWTYAQKYENMVAGYWDQYHENIDFLTFRGAGHFVPADKPRESLQMIGNFLAQNRNFSKPIHVNLEFSPRKKSDREVM